MDGFLENHKKRCDVCNGMRNFSIFELKFRMNRFNYFQFYFSLLNDFLIFKLRILRIRGKKFYLLKSYRELTAA